MGKIKTVEDVVRFMGECSGIVGAFENEMFNQDVSCEIEDNEIESPIEQIFYAAFWTLARVNQLKRSDPLEINGTMFVRGIELLPQHHIGKYRVDFLAESHKIRRGEQIKTEVIVECDSQQFHDRTEQERRHEKVRDRFLQVQGYKIFHFTGKEIKDHPFRVVAEVVAFLEGCKTEDILDPNFIPEDGK